PIFSARVLGPTSTTSPMNSCPRTSPERMVGITPLNRCRSEPQIAVDVTRTTASCALTISGSGTVSTRTSRGRTSIRRASSLSMVPRRCGGYLVCFHALLEAAQVLAHLLTAAPAQHAGNHRPEPAAWRGVAEPDLHLGAVAAESRREAHEPGIVNVGSRDRTPRDEAPPLVGHDLGIPG